MSCVRIPTCRKRAEPGVVIFSSRLDHDSRVGDLISQHPQAVDLDLDDVPGFEKGLSRRADARGGTGGDDVARLQGDEAADPGDRLGHVKDHVTGRGILADLSVDARLDRQSLRVGDLAYREKWAQRAKG